jgi:hypothetical protein
MVLDILPHLDYLTDLGLGPQALQFLERAGEPSLRESASRIATALLDGSTGQLQAHEEEMAECIRRVAAEARAYVSLADSNACDLFLFKSRMPIIQRLALQRPLDGNGARSLALCLPKTTTVDEFKQSQDALRVLRRPLDTLAHALQRGERQGTDLYMRVDISREQVLRTLFTRDSVTVPSYVQYVMGLTTQHRARWAVPDVAFALSFGGGLRRQFDTERWSAFTPYLLALDWSIDELTRSGSRAPQVVVQSVLAGIVDFGLDFFAARTGLQAGHRATVGELSEELQRFLKGGPQSGVVAYLMRKVVRWRNDVSHPATHPELHSQSKGECLAMVCRVADLFQYLDAVTDSKALQGPSTGSK